MLGVQLHLSVNSALQETVFPVQNSDYLNYKKPWGGFWTSTYEAEEDLSEWEYIYRDRNGGFAYRFLLTPDPAARIVPIDSAKDFIALLTKYPRRVNKPLYEEQTFLDFEAIMQDYDAIHLTAEGEQQTRLMWPNNLGGWDVESTLWFRWMFTRVELLPPVSRTTVEQESAD